MKVTRAGYRDPNDLKFENITVLGVPSPPSSVSVTRFGTADPGNPTTTVLNIGVQYDTDKKVKMLRLSCKVNLRFSVSEIYSPH